MIDAETPSTPSAAAPTRRVTRQRGLPGGRAVVGALLVAAAAVGVFAAHVRATAEPGTRYLVASQDIDAGTRVDRDNLDTLFGHLPLDLAPAVADNSILLEAREQVIGQVVTGPLARGDLVSRSSLVDDGGAPDAFTMSFPVAAADAVAGSLQRGQRIDVLATYGSGESAYTAYVVAGVPLVAVDRPGDGGFGAGDQRVLTVALTEQQQVQALAHAVAVADVVVTRAPEGVERDGVPDAYRPGGSVTDGGDAPASAPATGADDTGSGD
ncbi:SAF domain-containing protein [Egicoccus sp. AB-alg2]|uniref:SAF domain-containing protein n=1 Tax=Egicoccus sp. AB-alg2 TaxID=3242693 RepID=UPI00359E9FCC